jgi:hypothetical protein
MIIERNDAPRVRPAGDRQTDEPQAGRRHNKSKNAATPENKPSRKVAGRSPTPRPGWILERTKEIRTMTGTHGVPVPRTVRQVKRHNPDNRRHGRIPLQGQL